MDDLARNGAGLGGRCCISNAFWKPTSVNGNATILTLFLGRSSTLGVRSGAGRFGADFGGGGAIDSTDGVGGLGICVGFTPPPAPKALLLNVSLKFCDEFV